ncbi:MAG: Trm112 family protein [Aestuariibacter sp.]|uniref:Trm112 family protein n=1 Tax=Marisediminitalea aggregata TaxID=634436 RepID=UPI0020CCB2A5|nr:Trm112 family protein [Marisediminitalea aggregata]MCP3863257.1 Trm112 family protein [Aestuariibacter sp.]MCP4237127.1 Trm112 family protein [Aestuariibacter sp.]MCP4527305.1 Trm112 family protein [Aestuariibacter sp.]MCP4949596.1 Trm112 family protein [Aestuariibacter sp.]MCP5008938.1 Trm112 family protein [Aestuariibacter sp.]|tara:strand:+ start:517 stop:723 length:207 start_codon:yes stop_codon:yes gene_type:complete
MAFDRKLLDVIACPVCKGKLLFTQHNDADALVCRFDRLVYPLKDGIPVLLEEQATSITLEQLEALKKG